MNEAREQAAKARLLRKWMGISQQTEIRPLSMTMDETNVYFFTGREYNPENIIMKMRIEDFEAQTANRIVDSINEIGARL